MFIQPGVNNGVQGEIDNLERFLCAIMALAQKLYLIPSEDSQRCLQRKIFLFQEEHDSRNELLVVYYGGYGVLNEMD